MNDPYPEILLTAGIPMFFIFIAIELFVAYFLIGKTEGYDDQKPKHAFRFNDMVVSTVLGAFQQGGTLILELFGFLMDVQAYIFVYNTFHLMEIHPKSNPWGWYLFIMLGRDLGYYCYHRFLHEVGEE